MAITLGELWIDRGEVNSSVGSVDRNDAKCFTNYDGGLTQSLDDILIVKLMEVTLGKTKLENPDADMFFIPCTEEEQYWVQIIRTSSGYEIEVGEPAA